MNPPLKNSTQIKLHIVVTFCHTNLSCETLITPNENCMFCEWYYYYTNTIFL